MQNKISSFANMDEAERMLYIARLHHAIWHDEAVYRAVDMLITKSEERVPEAIYFPNGEQIDDPKTDTI